MFPILVCLSLLGEVCNTPAKTQSSQQKAETKINASPLLRERIDMGALTFPSVDEALRQLARRAHVRINLQLFSDGATAAQKEKAFTLAAQESSVGQMLANLKASIPGLTWTADEASITITIWRSKNVNPLDVPIAIEVNRKFTALELVTWLYEQNLNVPLIYMEDYGSFDSKQTCEMRILPGVTRRMVLNSFAGKMQLRWIAQGSNTPVQNCIQFARKAVEEAPK